MTIRTGCAGRDGKTTCAPSAHGRVPVAGRAYESSPCRADHSHANFGFRVPERDGLRASPPRSSLLVEHDLFGKAGAPTKPVLGLDPRSGRALRALARLAHLLVVPPAEPGERALPGD